VLNLSEKKKAEYDGHNNPIHDAFRDILNNQNINYAHFRQQSHMGQTHTTYTQYYATYTTSNAAREEYYRRIFEMQKRAGM
jgi:hypothetical protein